jgi:ABC-2 type transport system permease protein
MSRLAGTGALLRLAARRDRLIAPMCLVYGAGFVLLTAVSFKSLYPSQPQLDRFAATIEGNAAFTAIYGTARGLHSLGGLVAWRCASSGALFIGLMSILLVVRHTRAEEEQGLTELVRSAAVGRDAPATAAVAMVGALDLAIAVAIALGLIATGLPAAGSIALGAALGGSGLVFAAVAAFAAQASQTARGARGIAGLALGLAFVLRAVGDSGSGALAWLSPIGWVGEMRAFAGERWWPLALPLGAAAALLAGAYALLARRDLGAGLLVPGPGPPTASPLLRRPMGLAVRLQRGGLLAWSAGLLAVGAVMGAIAVNAADLVDTGKALQNILTQSGGSAVVDAFFASVVLLLALIATGYTIQATLRLRVEELAGHAEPLLATALGRLRWAAGHLVMALGGSVLVVAAGGIGIGAAYAIATGDAVQLPRLVGSALAQLPAVWIIGGLAMLLVGLVPRAVWLAWAALGACALVWFVGPLVHAPGWVLDLSPYNDVPAVPAATVTAGPLVLLTLIGAGLTALGLLALRRRDVG